MTNKPWLTGIKPIDYRLKESLIRNHINLMINRCLQMFKINGLPESIPEDTIKSMLMNGGHCFIPDEIDAVLYGSIGGEPNEYYRGKRYIVSNPGLNLSKEYIIDVDGVLCRNDSGMIGLMPIHRRYATLLTENELSMYIAEINSRLQFQFAGSTDADKLSADDIINGLEKGKLSAVASSDFLGGIAIQPGAQSVPAVMQALIEAEQFIKASWFNEIGLDSNYNMKRESLTTAESQMNSDALLPLVDNMRYCWEEWIDKVNTRKGWNLTLDYDSSWEDNQEQINENPEEQKEEETENVNAD